MSVSEPRVISLFPSSVVAEQWPEAPQFNELLKTAMLAKQAEGGGVNKSNLLGWKSDLDMLQWGGDAARRLVEYIMRRCDLITADLGSQGERRFRWSAEMWANVSRSGAFSQTHAHPGSFWSAVYYVDDGFEGSTDKALGGELTFVDPRFPMVRMRTPDLRYRRPDGSRDHHEVLMRPRSGVLVIYPSWLQHSVKPYFGRGTRMSIAINLLPRPIEERRDG